VLVPFPKFRYFFAALSARICGRERGGDTVQSARELFNMKKRPDRGNDEREFPLHFPSLEMRQREKKDVVYADCVG